MTSCLPPPPYPPLVVSRDAPGLTAKQAAVLDACTDYVEANGFPPTRRELAAALGYRSVGSVQFHLDALARKGLVSRDPQRPRALSWSRAEHRDEPGGVSPDSSEIARTDAGAGWSQVPVVDSSGRTLRWVTLPSSLAGEGAVAVFTDAPCPDASVLRGDMLVLNRRGPSTSDLVALGEGTRVRVVRWPPESRGGPRDRALGVVAAVIRRV